MVCVINEVSSWLFERRVGARQPSRELAGINSHNPPRRQIQQDSAPKTTDSLAKASSGGKDQAP
jgi:hypothetical protein